MGIFDKLKVQTALIRRREEMLYEIALQEVEKGLIRPGLWAQALSQSDGDKAKAEGRYLKLRVASLKDEENVFGLVSERLKEAAASKDRAARDSELRNQQTYSHAGEETVGDLVSHRRENSAAPNDSTERNKADSSVKCRYCGFEVSAIDVVCKGCHRILRAGTNPKGWVDT